MPCLATHATNQTRETTLQSMIFTSEKHNLYHRKEHLTTTLENQKNYTSWYCEDMHTHRQGLVLLSIGPTFIKTSNTLSMDAVTAKIAYHPMPKNPSSRHQPLNPNQLLYRSKKPPSYTFTLTPYAWLSSSSVITPTEELAGEV